MWRAPRLGHLAEHRETIHLGHSQVEKDDVGCGRRNEAQSFGAIDSLADDVDLRQERKKAADALANQCLIVDEENFDHGTDGRMGSQPTILKPRPRSLSNAISP